MLTVLLFRCSGFVELKAGDLLQLMQFCKGDERSLIALLLTIICNRNYEWQLIQAAVRCIYELSTPASYFQPGVAAETIKVTAFSAKMVSMVTNVVKDGVLSKLFQEFSERWALSANNKNPTNGGGEGLGVLGSPQTLNAASVLSPTQKQELLNWSVVLRYLSVLTHNLLEFSDSPTANRDLQQALIGTAQGQRMMSVVVIPYVMAVLHTWERAMAAGTMKGNDMRNPYLNSALAALRLLRVALYKPKVALDPSLQQALAALVQLVTRLHPQLRSEYTGMLAMLFVVECLCNANARTITAPVNLAGSLDVLLTTISQDKSPLRPGAQCNTAQGFAVCFAREESPFVVTTNESVELLHQKFAKEEQEIKEDAEAYAAIEKLEEQLDALQAMIFQLALGQLLGELAMAGAFNQQPGVIGHQEPPATAASPSAAASPSKKKKKHPKQFCCQLTGKLMREPVTLKNGHQFEYEALMDVVKKVGQVDPLTGEAFNEEIEINHALQQEIAQYKVNKATSK
ncbi:hypothetical protein AGDE_07160 [Angomonas deanei]|nr:hypothetical protein AGDE_07160 [Angomonas deanei]|eukprot:EPY35945.1 hypothetical protein AGDE_07160 [Angomonas deanei]